MFHRSLYLRSIPIRFSAVRWHHFLYDRLGLSKVTSDKQALKNAYHQKIHQFHPDHARNDKTKLFFTTKTSELNEAYEILMNEVSRNKYHEMNKEELSKFERIWRQKYNLTETDNQLVVCDNTTDNKNKDSKKKSMSLYERFFKTQQSESQNEKKVKDKTVTFLLDTSREMDGIMNKFTEKYKRFDAVKKQCIPILNEIGNDAIINVCRYADDSAYYLITDLDARDSITYLESIESDCANTSTYQSLCRLIQDLSQYADKQNLIVLITAYDNNTGYSTRDAIRTINYRHDSNMYIVAISIHHQNNLFDFCKRAGILHHTVHDSVQLGNALKSTMKSFFSDYRSQLKERLMCKDEN